MTEATTPTATNTDILNARLPGCKDLQMLAVDATGIIQEVCSMDKVFKRISPPDLQVIDVAGDWQHLQIFATREASIDNIYGGSIWGCGFIHHYLREDL